MVTLHTAQQDFLNSPWDPLPFPLFSQPQLSHHPHHHQHHHLSVQPLSPTLPGCLPLLCVFFSRCHHFFPSENIFSSPSAWLLLFASSLSIFNQQIKGSLLESVLLRREKEAGETINSTQRWSQPGESTVSFVV